MDSAESPYGLVFTVKNFYDFVNNEREGRASRLLETKARRSFCHQLYCLPMARLYSGPAFASTAQSVIKLNTNI